MKHLSILFVISTILFSCNENENYTIEENTIQSNKKDIKANVDLNLSDYTWLNGSWRDTTKRKREIHEVWSTSKDSLYGIGFYVFNGTDTSTKEKSIIKLNEDGDYYLSNFTKENKVKFKLKAFSKDSLHFSNPAHRYPQDVTYKRITNDSITILFDGYVHQAQRKFRFYLQKY